MKARATPSFHLCPLRSRVKRLFAKAPELLFQPRQPITQRAAELLKQRCISEAQVRQYLGQEDFFLATNQFAIFNEARNFDQAKLATLIANFGSIIKHGYVEIFTERKTDDHPIVTVKIFPFHLNEVPKYPIKDMLNSHVVRLEFRLQEDIELLSLGGTGQGYTGHALAALYNFAKSHGYKEIYYYVRPRNVAAKRFYFHMDFGKPTREDPSWWQVLVR